MFALKLAGIAGGHGDILLRLGNYRHVCDSYYYLLDDLFMDGVDLSQGLARFLDGWLARVEELRQQGGGTVFLPFDFSDQCTAWLRVSSANGVSAEVSAGWSAVEGWAVMPSDFGSFANAVDDFAPISGASVDTGVDDLVVAIATTRDALRR